MMSQADPEFRSQCRQSSRGDGFRHRLIEHGADNPSVNDSTKSLGKYFRHPFGKRLTGFAGLESKMQTVRVVRATGKA